MTERSDFDVELTRAFALADDPADDGFTVALTQRVAHVETRRRMGRGLHATLMGLAGAAGAFALWQVISAVGPKIAASMGPDLAYLVTAQAPAISLGMPLTMLLGAAAGAGIVWMQRSAE
jgi:hypothetical protein